MSRIHIEATVRATESPARVKAAILNLFPDARLLEEEDSITGEATSLDRLKEMFRNQRIRDTAKAVLRSSRIGQQMRFSLNKQAAYVDRANFAPPSPMGPIEVIVEDDDLDRVIEFLCEKREHAGGDDRRGSRP